MYELLAICYSENTGDSFAFGWNFDSKSELENISVSRMTEGLYDSFCENYFEFADGLNDARLIYEDDPHTSLREALFSVFGHFKLSFELNGEPYDPDPGFDVDRVVYELLLNLPE